jgi:hypothetical protein
MTSDPSYAQSSMLFDNMWRTEERQVALYKVQDDTQLSLASNSCVAADRKLKDFDVKLPLRTRCGTQQVFQRL